MKLKLISVSVASLLMTTTAYADAQLADSSDTETKTNKALEVNTKVV